MISPPLGEARPCQNTKYKLRLATNQNDVTSAQRLRFNVFNLELNEGLDASYLTGLDRDAFDEVCDHLLVEDTVTGQVVGTYRLQTGLVAATAKGYYSANEFDFSPYENLRSQMVELGRACVHLDHRSLGVINLLWRGIAQYARERGARYLIGCSSLTSENAAVGWATYAWLRDRALVNPRLQTDPLPGFGLGAETPQVPLRPPRLLRAYVSAGAKICGPPAIDREFRTIDFLTWMDLNTLSSSAQNHFFA